MNKQRKVLITITYNEMGIIIDTKTEEVAQPNLQPTCNQLATDTISRQAAIDDAKSWVGVNRYEQHLQRNVIEWLKELPSAEPQIIRCKDCREFRRYIDTDITFCDRTEVEVKDDDFCSHAERNTDA